MNADVYLYPPELEPRAEAARRAADRVPPLISHWQPPPPRPEGPACRHTLLTRSDGPAFTLTILRRDVTCDACKNTTAWKGTPQ